jgi:molybdopterin molybdotransferase
MEEALATDLVITSAGISVGEHDYVRSVVESLGGSLDFWRVRMRPGAPVGFGLIRGVPWIGLPGNPVSTMVTFELFARAAIRRMAGRALPWRRTREVRVAEPIRLGPRLQHFLRVVVTQPGEALEARLTGPQGSGILSSMARANALLVVPEDRQELAAGETARALLLDETLHQAEPPF